MPQQQSDGQLYAKMLLPRCYGYPLWIPEPDNSLPEEYITLGLGIGDVGYISPDGAFHYLFNVCAPADDPINAGGTPEGFVHMSLRVNEITDLPHRFTKATDILSENIVKRNLSFSAALEAPPAGFNAGFEFTSDSKEGAILMLPEGGSRKDVKVIGRFRDYARVYAASWYKFANIELQREVRNGSLYLVTGRDMTSSWGTACFSNRSQVHSFSLRFLAKDAAEAGASMSYSWETMHSVVHRTSQPDLTSPNQCVFLRGFRIAFQENVFKKMFLGPIHLSTIIGSKPAEHLTSQSSVPFSPGSTSSYLSVFGSSSGPMDSEVDNPENEQEELVLEHVPDESELFHPSDIINHFLLRDGREVAITHDEDWMSLVIKLGSRILEPEELKRHLIRHGPPHEDDPVPLSEPFLVSASRTMTTNPEAVLPTPATHPDTAKFLGASARNLLDVSLQNSEDISLDQLPTDRMTPASQQDRPPLDQRIRMQNIARSQTSHDPVAAKFLELSIKRLSPYFGEPICLGRFVQAALDRAYLKEPVSEADALFIALDTLTFNLQNVQGNVEYQNRCYNAFTNLITTSDLDRWFDEIEDINRSIKRLVLSQNPDPNVAKQFTLAQNQYLQSMRQDRLGYLAEETITLTLRRNEFRGDMDGALNDTSPREELGLESTTLLGVVQEESLITLNRTPLYKGFNHSIMSVD